MNLMADLLTTDCTRLAPGSGGLQSLIAPDARTLRVDKWFQVRILIAGPGPGLFWCSAGRSQGCW